LKIVGMILLVAEVAELKQILTEKLKVLL